MRRISFLLLLFSLAVFGPARADSRRLTLEEAERLALSDNPFLLVSNARARTSEAGTTIGRMLPSVTLTDEYQHWNSPYSIAFSLPGTDPSAAGPGIEVRGQETHTFTATASQPLLGLLRLYAEHKAQKQSTEALRADLRVSESAVRKAMRVAFLQHFEAKALEEIARQSEKELKEQVTIANAKLKAGVLTNADLLRVQVAAANAEQQEIVARTQADIAKATILIGIGANPDDSVELVEPDEILKAARAEPEPYAKAVDHALTTRPEMFTARLNIEAAKQRQRARFYSLLPSINLEGGYIHIDGQKFAPPDAGFIGLKSAWQIWDWGATYADYRAAKVQSESASLEVLAQKRTIAKEVAIDLMQSRSARSAVRLAEQSIESAAEAYRVTDALLKAGSATTTDLLESQAALSQARLNLVRAQYQLALAYVAIQHSTGAS